MLTIFLVWKLIKRTQEKQWLYCENPQSWNSHHGEYPLLINVKFTPFPSLWISHLLTFSYVLITFALFHTLYHVLSSIFPSFHPFFLSFSLIVWRLLVLHLDFKGTSSETACLIFSPSVGHPEPLLMVELTACQQAPIITSLDKNKRRVK